MESNLKDRGPKIALWRGMGTGKTGIFTKYCAFCDRKIEKGQDTVRFGKHFDSEAHAETYAKEREEEKRSIPSVLVSI